MAALVAPLQVIAGDLHGLNTFEHQPAKVAAMEGHYVTKTGAPLILFGIPNSAERRIDYAVEIPQIGSLILTHSLDGKVRGLEDWPEQDWPNVPIVFFSFRLMVILGLLMVLIGFASLYLRYQYRLYVSPLFTRAVLYMGPSGLVALLAGWVTTEVGRQPYTVYGLLRTSDSVSPIDTLAVGASLLAFVLVYFIVFGAGIFYLFRIVSQVPASHTQALPIVTSSVKGRGFIQGSLDQGDH